MGATARTLTARNAQEIADWCGGVVVIQHDALEHSNTTPGVNVPTPEGVQRAQVGNTIVQNADGTFEIFKHLPTIKPF